MSHEDAQDFERLKQVIRQKLAKKFGITRDLKHWNLNDIRRFQDDLEHSCRSTLSEKWVYTHFKRQGDRLPRVDVLDLLSRYAGFESWDLFRNSGKSKPGLIRRIWKPVILILGLVGLSMLIWRMIAVEQYQFMLIRDAYSLDTLDLSELHVEGRAQKHNGYLRRSKQDTDSVVIQGKYYKGLCLQDDDLGDADTLLISLYPDDYALMIHYFSLTSDRDLMKRKGQLEACIHDQAEIFHVHPVLNGLEMLNKDDFINRLILPTGGLKGLDIQDIKYKDGQIYRLRFVDNTHE